MMLLNIVEFYVIDNIDENFFLQDHTVVKSVSDWILYKRLHSGYSSSNPTNSSNSAPSTKTNDKMNNDLIVIDDVEYNSKDNKFPEMGDESISSTKKIIFHVKFLDKIIFNELKDFILLNSNEDDDVRIKDALEFKNPLQFSDPKNKIEIIIMPKYFLNLIKGVVVKKHLKAREQTDKEIIDWLLCYFKFTKASSKAYLYRVYTDVFGKAIIGFEDEFEDFFNTLNLKIKNSKKKVNEK